ncbi:hypothetical protein JOF41_002920 [Saccharothrix coeruleofusca]|uniref:hypothetical protein n=1 Tax=Saccharothrix coeruleofusca TaxID=33919 RepID=UPI001AE62E53|nr:hypothetical protein [Saccharothrix coeruleofusca]MBP2336742.1 hypothetical protein [Saccharothrix coeruleofusca]
MLAALGLAVPPTVPADPHEVRPVRLEEEALSRVTARLLGEAKDLLRALLFGGPEDGVDLARTECELLTLKSIL